MFILQIRYRSSHRAALTGTDRWQPYGDGRPVPPGLAVVSLISPPAGSELRAVDAWGESLSVAELQQLTAASIAARQLQLFSAPPHRMHR